MRGRRSQTIPLFVPTARTCHAEQRGGMYPKGTVKVPAGPTTARLTRLTFGASNVSATLSRGIQPVPRIVSFVPYDTRNVGRAVTVVAAAVAVAERVSAAKIATPRVRTTASIRCTG